MAIKLNGSTSGSVALDAPADTSPSGTDVTLTLPTSAGSSGQVLTTNGSGTLSWGPNLPDAIDVNASAPADSVNIDSNGRLGVGITSPSTSLHVSGANTGARGQVCITGASADARLSLYTDSTFLGHLSANTTSGLSVSTESTYPITFLPAGTERIRLQTSGQTQHFSTTDNCIRAVNSAGAGTTYANYFGHHSGSSTTSTGTLSFAVYTNGDVQNTNGSYTQLSDEKLKENIVDANSQWDDIKAIRIRNWNFKEETGHQTHRQIGPVAQEVEQVCPGLVFETPDRDEDGNETGEVTKGVNQSILYMKAIKALQEAMERIETLETANASQAATIATLDARLTALEGGAS